MDLVERTMGAQLNRHAENTVVTVRGVRQPGLEYQVASKTCSLRIGITHGIPA